MTLYSETLSGDTKEITFFVRLTEPVRSKQVILPSVCRIIQIPRGTKFLREFIFYILLELIGVIVKDQAPVVRRLDNAIQRISVNKTNQGIHWIVIYPVDSVIHFSNNRGQVFKLSITICDFQKVTFIFGLFFNCTQYTEESVTLLQG